LEQSASSWCMQHIGLGWMWATLVASKLISGLVLTNSTKTPLVVIVISWCRPIWKLSNMESRSKDEIKAKDGISQQKPPWPFGWGGSILEIYCYNKKSWEDELWKTKMSLVELEATICAFIQFVLGILVWWWFLIWIVTPPAAKW
jgi:hypothetical protein